MKVNMSRSLYKSRSKSHDITYNNKDLWKKTNYPECILEKQPPTMTKEKKIKPKKNFKVERSNTTENCHMLKQESIVYGNLRTEGSKKSLASTLS